MKLILASASPRRNEILSKLNIPFDIIRAQIEESVNCLEDVSKAAIQKAQWVFNNSESEDSIVLGADTVVYINDEILEKPKNLEDAKKMILKLSNKEHSVYTGVALISKKKKIYDLIETKISVCQLTTSEIDQYIKTENILDAAGAYKIQGSFSKFIYKIQGDFFNVVGLPLFWVYKNLKNFGLL